MHTLIGCFCVNMDVLYPESNAENCRSRAYGKNLVENKEKMYIMINKEK